MKVIVRTLLTQELEVPEGTDRYGVFDFLSETQSFRTAFQGATHKEYPGFVIKDICVVEETVEQLGEECFDE